MARVNCAVHPEVDAEETCAECEKPACDECAVYEIDGRVACAACAAREHAKSRAVGSALLGFIGASYLATLALAVTLFKPRPFVGGLAAVVAIAAGRVLQIVLRPRTIARRAG